MRRTLLTLSVLLCLGLPARVYGQASVTIVGTQREDAPATSGDRVIPIAAVRVSSCGTPSAGSNGDYIWFNVNANGNLCMSVAENNAGSATITEAATEPAGAANAAIVSAYLKAFDGTTFSRVRGRSAIISSGDFGLVTRPFLPSDGTNTMPAMDAVGRPGFFKLTDGTNTMPTMDSTARPGFMQPIVGTTGGTTPYSTGWSSAAVFTAQIKGSAGQVYALDCFNNTNAKKYIRLYDQTGAPASTDSANIKWRGVIPADVANNGGSGYILPMPEGATFSTGIGIRISGAVADNDTTALSANDVNCNARYK